MASIDLNYAQSLDQQDELVHFRHRFAPIDPHLIYLDGNSLGHQEGYRISQALIEEMQVLPDFRAPDNISLGLAPLYTSYTDVQTAVSRIHTIVTEKRYEKYSNTRGLVT